MEGDNDRPTSEFLGRSLAANDVREFVRRAARIDCSVLITGESGVGKELVAREIHDHSPRKEQVFFDGHDSIIQQAILRSPLPESGHLTVLILQNQVQTATVGADPD